MAIRAMALSVLVLAAAPAWAGKPFDVHGLIIGNEGARYLRGVPTLDLQQQRGAMQVRSLGFHNNRPVFAVAFYNAGPEPMNIGLEDIHASSNGAPLRVFPVEELERQAKNKAFWSQVGLALVGGVGAAAASSRRDTYRSTITGPYGTYRVHANYPSLAGQLQADRITADTAWGMAAIQYQLDRTIELINDHVIQRTTIDPGATYGGIIVLDKLKVGDPPFELRLDVDWNGERYPFAYVMQRPGKPVPQQYAGRLAANAKPRALNTAFARRPAQANAPEAGQGASPTTNRKGWIVLASGAVKIPAKTRSGYCLKAPDDYVATGAKDTPTITRALPRCLDDTGRVAKRRDGPLRLDERD